jgi:hypothetical protein
MQHALRTQCSQEFDLRAFSMEQQWYTQVVS